MGSGVWKITCWRLTREAAKLLEHYGNRGYTCFMKPVKRDPPQQKRIVWKQWRGRPPIPSWWLYLFSAPAILAGLFSLALGFGILPLPLQVPELFVMMFGCNFLFMGLVLFYLASEPIIKRVKLDSTSRYHADYPWSTEGISEDMESPIKKTLLGAVVLTGFLVPIHFLLVGIIVSGTGIERILLIVVFGLFDLILLAHIQVLINFGWQRLNFGKTRVQFHRFPFFVGQTLAVTLEGGNQLASQTVVATLRCIEEKIRYSSRYDEEGQIVCYEVYAVEREFNTDGTGQGDLSFSLPPAVPGTRLKDDLPIYWELVVKSSSRWPQYKRVFLMPVYNPLISMY